MVTLGVSIALSGLFSLEPVRTGSQVRGCLALEAVGWYSVASRLCDSAFTNTLDPRTGLAAGRALLELGDTESALAWAERLVQSSEAEAWQLAAKVHDRRGDREREEEANLREMALRRATGNHARAADLAYRRFYFADKAAHYGKALAFARQSLEEARNAADGGREALALQAVFVVLYKVGDLPRALQLLPILSRTADKLTPEQRLPPAQQLIFEGLLSFDTDRLELARGAFEQAIELAASSGDRQMAYSAHLNLTRTWLALGQRESAAQELESARRFADPTSAPDFSFFLWQARLLEANGELAEAANVLRGALAADPERDWASDLEHRLGWVEEARGDLPAAEAAYRRSAALVEEMIATAGGDEIRSLLVDDKRRSFESLFRLFARSERYLEAMEIVEHAKARTFLEAVLHSGSPPSSDDMDAPAIALAANQQLAAFATLLPPVNESPLVAPRPLGETLAHLGDRPLLAYFEAGDELWLIVISSGRVELHLLPASPTRVQELVERFLENPDDPETSDELGAILMPDGALPAPGPLLIAPDGVLGDLPFAAVRRQGRHLVEDFAIAYVPSASALVAIETRPSGHVGPAVVLADPRGDLTEAALEAQHVAAKLGVTPHLGAAATRSRLEEGPRANVLHLATHTGLSPGGAWLALHDGQVAAELIVTGRIGPRLVVLAGCASAARVGRGMGGSLGAAFLVAGSRTVVASLWSVEDKVTREFVESFYERGGAVAPAAALSAAQRELIAAGRPVSAWAPFVVLGSDPSPKLLQ